MLIDSGTQLGYDPLYAARVGSTLWGDEPGRLVRRLGEWTSVVGRALDAGCGDGKNASWLAHLGWEVTGFDASGVAIQLLMQRTPPPPGAYLCLGIEEFLRTYNGGRFDLIVSYGLFHCLPSESRLSSHQSLIRLLRPGGLMLFSSLTDELPWPDGHGSVDYELATTEEITELRSLGTCRYAERAAIVEDHLPVIGQHRHSSAWLVLEKR